MHILLFLLMSLVTVSSALYSSEKRFTSYLNHSSTPCNCCASVINSEPSKYQINPMRYTTRTQNINSNDNKKSTRAHFLPSDDNTRSNENRKRLYTHFLPSDDESNDDTDSESDVFHNAQKDVLIASKATVGHKTLPLFIQIRSEEIPYLCVVPSDESFTIAWNPFYSDISNPNVKIVPNKQLAQYVLCSLINEYIKNNNTTTQPNNLQSLFALFASYTSEIQELLTTVNKENDIIKKNLKVHRILNARVYDNCQQHNIPINTMDQFIYTPRITAYIKIDETIHHIIIEDYESTPLSPDNFLSPAGMPSLTLRDLIEFETLCKKYKNYFQPIIEVSYIKDLVK